MKNVVKTRAARRKRTEIGLVAAGLAPKRRREAAETTPEADADAAAAGRAAI
jgi:hypothetical protein